MSAKGFKSVFMVGAAASAALGCYLVSLSVASTRAELESVESGILMAQRDIRTLETEVGTRGRLAQLERWNANFIRLSAPQADQFVEGAFQLATLTKPEPKSTLSAPVVLASAPAPERAPVLTDDSAEAPSPRAGLAVGDMMHTASLSTGRRQIVAAETTRATPPRPAVKAAKSATDDPLAPLPGGSGKAKAPVGKTKDSGSN